MAGRVAASRKREDCLLAGERCPGETFIEHGGPPRRRLEASPRRVRGFSRPSPETVVESSTPLIAGRGLKASPRFLSHNPENLLRTRA